MFAVGFAYSSAFGTSQTRRALGDIVLGSLKGGDGDEMVPDVGRSKFLYPLA